MRNAKLELALTGLILVGLSIVIVWGPNRVYEPRLVEGARTEPVRFGTDRGIIEIVEPAGEPPTFRILWRDGPAEPPEGRYDEAAFIEAVGVWQYERLMGPGGTNLLFRLFNITSWTAAAWIIIGLGGQACFFLRMLVQWIASERARRSVVPEIFWWFSFFGAMALLVYFTWRRDVVGVLGQSTGVVVYVRNLRLIRAAEPPAVEPSSGSG